jgi:hypothetical protein
MVAERDDGVHQLLHVLACDVVAVGGGNDEEGVGAQEGSTASARPTAPLAAHYVPYSRASAPMSPPPCYYCRIGWQWLLAERPAAC